MLGSRAYHEQTEMSTLLSTIVTVVKSRHKGPSSKSQESFQIGESPKRCDDSSSSIKYFLVSYIIYPHAQLTISRIVGDEEAARLGTFSSFLHFVARIPHAILLSDGRCFAPQSTTHTLREKHACLSSRLPSFVTCRVDTIPDNTRDVYSVIVIVV